MSMAISLKAYYQNGKWRQKNSKQNKKDERAHEEYNHFEKVMHVRRKMGRIGNQELDSSEFQEIGLTLCCVVICCFYSIFF